MLYYCSTSYFVFGVYYALFQEFDCSFVCYTKTEHGKKKVVHQFFANVLDTYLNSTVFESTDKYIELYCITNLFGAASCSI